MGYVQTEIRTRRGWGLGGRPERPQPRRGTGRWSAKRKVSVVLELLRGADLEVLSRRQGVTAAKLSAWRDEFLAGGEAHLKSRETYVDDEETVRLKRVVAEQAVSNELLTEKIRYLEASGPLGGWRSKP